MILEYLSMMSLDYFLIGMVVGCLILIAAGVWR